jgi:TPP-dependent pyruvate/acetoin dehydrogenase alpha subunit
VSGLADALVVLQDRLEQQGGEHEEELETMRRRFQKQTSEIVRKHTEDMEAARERFENTKKGMQQQVGGIQRFSA